MNKTKELLILTKLEDLKDYLCVIGDNHLRNSISTNIQDIINLFPTEIEYKTCEHCGKEFKVTHEKQRFCPTKPGRKRSTCENTYNQRIRRQRQKEKAPL